MKTQIECKGKLQLEDVIQFSQAVHRKKRRMIHWVSLPILLFIAFMTVKPADSGLFVVPIVLMAVATWGFSWFSLKAALKKSAKKIFDTNKLVQSEFHYMFSPEGIKMSADFGERFMEWEEVCGVRMSKTHIGFAFSATSQYQIIPVSWLEPEHSRQDFEELLRSHISSDKLKQI